jgi:hypothetical protein
VIFLLLEVLILGAIVSIVFIKVPVKGSMEKSLEVVLSSGEYQHSYRLSRSELQQLPKIKTTIYMKVFICNQDKDPDKYILSNSYDNYHK